MSLPSDSGRRRSRLEKRLGRHFAFLGVLGQGSSGTVYEVTNLRLGRKEALKVLSDTQPEDFSARFSQEAKVAAAMDHPNIVKIYEFEQDRGSFWYSMQFIDGASLAQVLAARTPLDDLAVARLAIPLLDALHHSHAQGVIHRDIKPGNILLNESGRPFLTDFGIAKTTDNLTRTRTGTMMGTPAYVSPEQAMGQPVDHRADLYSLGVTLYELLAGRLPFTAENSLQTVVLRLKEDPEPLRDHCPAVREPFAAIIMRALARDREARWDTAGHMQEAFIRACEALGESWDRPMLPPEQITALRRSRSLDESTIVSLGGDGPWQTLYEPPAVARLWHRAGRGWILALAALLVAAVAWLGLRSRHRPAPVPPSPLPQAPAPPPSTPAAPTVPAAVPAPPKPSPARPRPEAAGVAPAPLRRAVTPPLLEETVPPVLQNAAECAGLTVNLSLRVGEDGRVSSCRVLSRTDAACAKAAREAGLRYRFKPALDAQGQPVEAVVAIAIILGEAP